MFQTQVFRCVFENRVRSLCKEMFHTCRYAAAVVTTSAPPLPPPPTTTTTTTTTTTAYQPNFEP